MRASNRITEIDEPDIMFYKGSPVELRLCKVVRSRVEVHPTVTEIVYCLKGSVRVSCNHETVLLKAGEIYTINYFDVHYLYSDEDNIVLVMHLDFMHEAISYGEIFKAYIDLADIAAKPIQLKDLTEAKARVLALSYSINMGKLTGDEATASTQRLMEILLGRFNWFNFVDSFPNENPDFLKRVNDVVVYCTKNYREKITISQLSKRVNISENYFSHFFKRSHYGSFNLMIGFIRCFYAQRLLINSELSVMEIAQECGFSDYKYFYKYFTYWWKEKPSDFRKRVSEHMSHETELYYLSEEEADDFLRKYISDFFLTRFL